MNKFTITVIGAGLIGTSMGLALKRAKEPPRLLIHDKEFELSKAAVSQGAFDKAEWNLINACDQADLIILAIPLAGVYPTLKAIAPDLKPGVIISDTTPNKVVVLAYAQELLPAHAHFIGGNPIVHLAGQGQPCASADIFKNQLYCLTPSPTANEEAVQSLVGFINVLGGTPFFMEATEHDGLVTAVEQLPALLSMALLNTLTTQPSWRELRKMAGGLFEQVSAGATGTPETWQESCQANPDLLIHWLDKYMAQLSHLRALLKNGAQAKEALLQQFDQAIVARHNWQVDCQKSRFISAELLDPPVEVAGFMKRWLGVGR